MGGLTKEEISDCEIVGGTSRIGILKKTLAEILGLDVSAVNYGLKTTMNSDEAVCRGAALQCAILSSKIKVKPFSVIDRVNYPIHLHFDDANATINTEGKGDDDDEGDSAANATSIELHGKGDSYPRGPKKITFKNKTNDFKLTLAYPDSATDLLPPGQDKHIATYTVKVPSGKPPAKVVVELNLDRNGCVVLQSAVIMEPIIEEEKKPEDKKPEENKNEVASEEKKEGTSEEKKEGANEEKKDSVEPPAPPKKRFTKVPLQF